MRLLVLTSNPVLPLASWVRLCLFGEVCRGPRVHKAGQVQCRGSSGLQRQVHRSSTHQTKSAQIPKGGKRGIEVTAQCPAHAGGTRLRHGREGQWGCLPQAPEVPILLLRLLVGDTKGGDLIPQPPAKQKHPPGVGSGLAL